MWPWTSVRAPGFPASLVLRLASAELAQASDEVLEAEAALAQARDALFEVLVVDPSLSSEEQRGAIRRARKALAKNKAPKIEDVPAAAQAQASVFTAALARIADARAHMVAAFADSRRQDSRALREIALMPRFREAIIWQNRGAVGSGLDALLRTAPDEEARSQQRQQEDLGFFGPIGWGRFEANGPTLVAKPGAGGRRRQPLHLRAPDHLRRPRGGAVSALAEHLMALPDSGWSVWRWTCLRGAGFPASLVQRLAASEAAEAADALFAAQAEAERAREAAVEALTTALRAAHGAATAMARRSRSSRGTFARAVSPRRASPRRPRRCAPSAAPRSA